ncbi:MAG: hypothetical protein B7C24_06645 [Bacteroidetes bacterium 4572_77]|nr:MAG: hypothetical protein B7C24_06645 [Bacteroidetes bacterium 4572_77]
MISMDGNNWEQLSADYDLDFNWNIQFYAEETATNVSANFGGNPTHIEEGQSVHFLDASIGATAWEWEFEGGSPATSTQQSPWVTYETPGTYDVKLIAKNGNDSDTEFRADYITVNAASGGEEIEVEVIADPGTSICESGNVLLTASATGGTGNYNYTWTWNLDASVVHGSQLSVSNLIQNAEVYLKVTSGTQEYNTSISLSVIDSPPASIVGKGSPETLLICPHADLEYQWYQNNSPISGATEQFYYPGENQTLSGTYYVETKNANACSSYSENHTIGTKSLSLSYEKYMRIFPNPSSGDFTIELSSLSDLEDIEELELSIYNLAGQEIWKAQLEHHFLSQVNPPLKWQKGLYLIKLKARGTIFETQKVIIY